MVLLIHLQIAAVFEKDRKMNTKLRSNQSYLMQKVIAIFVSLGMAFLVLPLNPANADATSDAIAAVEAYANGTGPMFTLEQLQLCGVTGVVPLNIDRYRTGIRGAGTGIGNGTGTGAGTGIGNSTSRIQGVIDASNATIVKENIDALMNAELLARAMEYAALVKVQLATAAADALLLNPLIVVGSRVSGLTPVSVNLASTFSGDTALFSLGTKINDVWVYKTLPTVKLNSYGNGTIKTTLLVSNGKLVRVKVGTKVVASLVIL